MVDDITQRHSDTDSTAKEEQQIGLGNIVKRVAKPGYKRVRPLEKNTTREVDSTAKLVGGSLKYRVSATPCRGVSLGNMTAFAA